MSPTDAELRQLDPGGRPSLFSTRFSLSSVGYTVDELLLTGRAVSFDRGEERDFATRLVVYRPSDPARADGTVICEWLNVSGGLEAPPLWMNGHTGIIRDGQTYVAVSAQALGVEGGSDLLGQRSTGGLRNSDPDRYGALRHPGDEWSYDIFAAAASALRRDGGALLGGIEPRLVLAGGHSQSAHRLVTFIHQVDGVRPVLDGYLVMGRGSGGAPLGPERLRTIADAPAAPLPQEGRVPVICLQAETDVVMLGSARSRIADGPTLRTWEVAGAAHADTYQLLAAPVDDGRRPVSELADLVEPTAEPFGIACDRPINSGLHFHYCTVAALRALTEWAAGGPVPGAADPLELSADGFALDDMGIAQGGVRTPFVDAPTAVLSGLGQSGGSFGRLFGTTTAIPPEELLERYGSEAGYLTAVEASLDQAVAAGFVLRADRDEVLGITTEQWRRRSAG